MFTPLLPSDVVHCVLDMDVVGCDLLREVDEWCESARASWDQAPSVEVVDVEDDDGGDEEGVRVILGADGFTTVMPVYSHFVKVWESSGHVNPFDVDWRRADMRDSDAMGYVSGALNLLRILGSMWGSDVNTSRCDVFRYFGAFVDSLERMLVHSISMGSLRAHVLAT